MTRLSRRELARLAAGVTVARAARLEAQAPAPSTYIGPLTGVDKGLEDRRFDPVRVHARSVRRGAAPAQVSGAHSPRRRGVAEAAPIEADRARRRLPGRAPAASPDHPRDAHISRLHPRENRVRQRARRQRARVSPASGKGAEAGGGHDLRARPRPRRGRHRRHRRSRERADRQGGLPARLRDPGGRSGHGGRGDRADGRSAAVATRSTLGKACPRKRAIQRRAARCSSVRRWSAGGCGT